MSKIITGILLLLCAAYGGWAANNGAAARGGVAMYNIVDYGAVGDGATLNTKAIQATVDACAAAGGGTVVLPAGIFVSGAIFLRSNIEFRLSAGTVLRGSRNFADYPLLDVKAQGYHIDKWWHASLLTGCNLENVSITGKGVLDGQGDVWWAANDAGTMKNVRPMLLYLFDCERVSIDGIKLLNSPSWTVNTILCRNMTIHDIDIKNPWKPYHNCDGIDLVSCSNVRVSNCHVDTGDDGITLKTVPDFGMICGRNAQGKFCPDYTKPRIPCENVVIENCVVEHGHCGVGVWAEVIGGMRNVVVNNCVFDGTRTGIRIARYPWPGGYVKDLRFNNIVMRRVEWVIECSSYLDPKTLEAGPDPETTPEISNIAFSNITATQARVACEMYGLPKMPVRNISFSNLRIEADMGFDLRNAENIDLDNVEVTCPGPALRAEAVRNLDVQRFTAPLAQADIPVMQFTAVNDAWIHGCKATSGAGVFVGLVGAENHDVVLEANRLPNPDNAMKPAEPQPAWSTSTYAYSGSASWRTKGNQTTFLPVPPAVAETIKREWAKPRITWTLNGIFRLESAAHPELTLAPGDKRRIYIITAWQVNEQLIILEDGTLLRKAEKFDWRMP